MKKSLIIIALALFECACAAHPGTPGPSASLLSFDAISNEITVSYEEVQAPDELSEVVASNP